MSIVITLDSSLYRDVNILTNKPFLKKELTFNVYGHAFFAKGMT